MSKIRECLNKIKSAKFGEEVRGAIHDAIETIDEIADTAQTSATKSAASALASEISAKASMESALVSEANAKQYMEQAFSGTPEGYSALVEQVGLLDIQESTDYVCPGSKPGGYRLNELVGATEQKSLSGKNKFNYDEWKGTVCERGTAVYENNGVTITATATDAYTTHTDNIPRVNVTEGDVVRISWEETTDASGLVYLFPNGGLSGAVSVNSAGTKRLKYTVQSGVTYITFRFGVVSRDTTISYKNIMITVNDDDLTFEPYCGGTASPNPDYPQAINNTFDCVEMMQGVYNSTTGIWASNTSYVCNKNKIPCASGDVICISTETSYTHFVIFYNENTYVSALANESAKSEFIVPSGVTHFNFDIYNPNKLTPQTVGKISLTINGKYVGQIVEHGKNLLDDEPYTEKITTFFLNEPLRATDRLVRKDGVVGANRKTKEYIITSDSPINKANSNADDYLYYVSLSDKKAGIVTSDKLIHKTYWGHTGKELADICIDGTVSDYPLVVFFNVGYYIAENTVTAVKEWLASNPIIIEYPLAEETFTPLDTASQIALNDMVTFDTVTYLEVDSRVQPSGISGEYGTSQVGALALENANLRDTVNLTTIKGSIADNLTTTEEGFVLDARVGPVIDERLSAVESVQKIQYLNGATLSNYTEPMRAIVENSTDTPINDECNNTALFEVEAVEDSLGRTILMQKYTALNPYVQGTRVRFSTYDTNWVLSDWVSL